MSFETLREKGEVYCYFECSGVFRDSFIRHGMSAADYDIADDYGTTDVKVDLFEAIDRSFTEGGRLPGSPGKDDLVIAFFPCTYFSDQSQLQSRGDSKSTQAYHPCAKLARSANHMMARALYYQTLCRLCQLAYRQGFALIIENPSGHCNFLRQYFPLRPAVIQKDRRIYGDNLKKPTQWFFVNCEPNFNLKAETPAKLESLPVQRIRGMRKRSLISPDFADYFIEQHIM